MENKTYAEAVKRLEEIVALLDDPQTEIDQLSALIKEAKGLVDFCRLRLTHTEEEVKEILEKTDNK